MYQTMCDVVKHQAQIRFSLLNKRVVQHRTDNGCVAGFPGWGVGMDFSRCSGWRTKKRCPPERVPPPSVLCLIPICFQR